MKIKQFIKKNRIVLCTLGIVLIGILIASGILFMKGEEESRNPYPEFNEDKSMVYVTGEKYSLNKEQEQEYLEHEKQQEKKNKEQPEEESILDHLIQNTETAETAPEGNKENNSISEEPGDGSGGNSSSPSGGAGGNGQGQNPSDEPGTGGSGQGEGEEGDNTGGEENESRAPLIETDLVNNMNVSGEYQPFEVWATDYTGKAMTADMLTVHINGVQTFSSGANEHKKHIKVKYINNDPLNDGANEVLIKAVDKEGNTSTKKYILNVDAEGPREEDGTVSITLELETLGLGTLASDSNFKIYKGETAAFIVDRFLKEKGIAYESTGSFAYGFYLKNILYPDITAGYNIPDKLQDKLKEENISEMPHEQNSLGEKDFYDGSGWMYMINGWIGDGMSTQTIRDGDDIHIGFTLNLMKEYNGDWFYYGEW